MKVPFKHWARDHSWIGKVWLTIPIFLLCGIFVGCRDSSDLRDSTPDQSGDTEDRADAFSRLMASGRTYYETDNYAQAQSAFESAQALFPTDADVTVNLANTFLRLGELDQAIEWADQNLEASGVSNTDDEQLDIGLDLLNTELSDDPSGDFFV